MGQRPSVAPEREAEEEKMYGPKDNTAGYGQEEKKLWDNIEVSKCLSPCSPRCVFVFLSLSLSHMSTEVSTFTRNKDMRYIFIKKCVAAFSLYGYRTH